MRCIDSTMLERESHLFDCTRSKPIQSSLPAGLTLASDFGFCFQCKVGSSLVLRPPIEITRVTGHLVLRDQDAGCPSIRAKGTRQKSHKCLLWRCLAPNSR